MHFEQHVSQNNLISDHTWRRKRSDCFGRQVLRRHDWGRGCGPCKSSVGVCGMPRSNGFLNWRVDGACTWAASIAVAALRSASTPSRRSALSIWVQKVSNHVLGRAALETPRPIRSAETEDWLTYYWIPDARGAANPHKRTIAQEMGNFHVLHHQARSKCT